MRKDLNLTQIFYLLIGDENFKKGVITVAKVTWVDQVQCRLQNDLCAAIWYKDIFDSDVKEKLKKKCKNYLNLMQLLKRELKI